MNKPAQFRNDASLPSLEGGRLANISKELPRTEIDWRGRCERLESILSMDDSGVLLASSEGKIQHVNFALCQMLGISDASSFGSNLHTFDDMVSALLDAPASSELRLTSIGQSIFLQPEMNVHRRLWQLVIPRRAILQVTGKRTPQGDLVFYFRDVTVETDVNRMKSEFLSTAAHELRTPLASIFGFTELLIARVMPVEKQRELLQTIHRQSRLLINLINELLDLSRIEARQGKDFHREHIRVDTIVQSTIDGLLVSNDSRQVQLHLPHGLWCISVDREKTMQALLNVLSNAFKYSPNGGEISITTFQKSHGSQDFVGIQVRDQGMGMTVAELARVFERFFRANPSNSIPGTGLGMSLVKEITELQGGHVQIESVYREGTAVTLWFPRAEQTEAT